MRDDQTWVIIYIGSLFCVVVLLCLMIVFQLFSRFRFVLD